VFEDLDSVVSDNVRSFFFNEVDGLSNNDGVLMVGSTNHLELLDPGISKRPSRFDRKYYFPNPDREERVKYCEYWRGKLSDSKDVDFPHRLCTAIADITDGFSFAYMQEAFVAALLVIASRKDEPANGWDQRRGITMWQDSSDSSVDSASPNGADRDLDKYILWREIKLQIKILREGIEGEKSPSFPQFSHEPGHQGKTRQSPPESSYINHQGAMPDAPALNTPRTASYLPSGQRISDIMNSRIDAPSTSTQANINIPTAGTQELSPAGDGIERRAAAAEREWLGKAQAMHDMRAALEASSDPHQLQDLKRAVEDYLFRRY
jgi:SpoVK/Ycf46/Vps4 family AAA+-type ATPase